MTSTPRLSLSGVVFDAPDPRELAHFYQRLLGGRIEQDEPGWVKLRYSESAPGLSFQHEENYVRPSWPAGPGEQQMSVHLDIAVDDLDGAGEHALACGARLAEFQPQPGVRVYLDPAGHPFCLFATA
ncbi:MAG: VOC family protein [Actinomycetota bacterium]|nr:VOC family protein [Actinomycetota bacterium]MDQ2957434.1 VOC family protein [Actinomycetota bacterium]